MNLSLSNAKLLVKNYADSIDGLFEDMILAAIRKGNEDVALYLSEALDIRFEDLGMENILLNYSKQMNDSNIIRNILEFNSKHGNFISQDDISKALLVASRKRNKKNVEVLLEYITDPEIIKESFGSFLKS